MASTEYSPQRNPHRRTRIFGVETEYGFAVIRADGDRLDPEASVKQLMDAVREHFPYLCRQGELDLFTSNGSRVYLDVGLHPEVATPECSTPEEAVAFTRAGDRLLVVAAKGMVRKLRDKDVEVVLWKANVDHGTGVTWASHESYLHTAPQSSFAEQLMSHLVSRVIYTGAGGFDNRVPQLRFVVSPRAFHLESAISNDSTNSRGIFHTRDEALAAPPNRRLHVLAGESLWSETADYLRIGTTALLVAVIDAGGLPQSGLDLASPLEALAAISADVTCTATVALKPSGRLTAIAIQRRLLECVEADLSADYMPVWASAVCELWRSVLDRLEASPDLLIGILDWTTKLAVLKRRCTAEGLEWVYSNDTNTSPRAAAAVHRGEKSPVVARLLETDMRFNRLDDSGIFAVLDQNGDLDHRIVPTEVVERALNEPPSIGRARIRAACIKWLAGNGSEVVCNWSRIVDYQNDLVLDLADPFQSEGEEWKQLLSDTAPSPRIADPMVEPIRHAFDAGDIPEALHQISLLVADSEAPSLSVCRYCEEVIGTLVPIVPVPIVRGGDRVGDVLEMLFERVVGSEDYALEERVGTLLYRCCEAHGRYDMARRVIGQQLGRARETGNRYDVAMLTNNLGYEHLLAEQWQEAEKLFEQAVELFENDRAYRDVVNTRANLLESRFGYIDPDAWFELMPSVVEVNRTLLANNDWRARKTLRLLARFAAHRGHWHAARGWVRKALTVSRGTSTQLREWDRNYLRELERRADVGSLRI